MNDTRDSYHHGDLARALLDAAVEIIAEAGHEAFTLREAARRVGVNHRAAYRHYSDKTALLAAIAEQGYRDLASSMQRRALRAGTDVHAELRAIGHAYVEFALDQTPYFRVMFGPRLNEDERFPELEREAQRTHGVVRDVLSRGLEQGALATPNLDDAVLTLWSAMHGLSTLLLMRRVRVSRKNVTAFADRILAPTLSGLTKRS